MKYVNTTQQIQQLSSALAKFCSVDTEELAQMMQDDQIDLKSIGQRKI